MFKSIGKYHLKNVRSIVSIWDSQGMVRFGRVLALSVSVIASACFFWHFSRDQLQWNLPLLASVNGSSLLRGPFLGESLENASGEIGEMLNNESKTYFSTTQLNMLSTQSQEFGTTSDVISTSKKLPEQMAVTSSAFQLDLPALPENLRGYCRCVQQGGHQPVGTIYAEEEMKSLLSEMRDNLKIFLYPIKHHCKVSWAKSSAPKETTSSMLRVKKCCNENTLVSWNDC